MRDWLFMPGAAVVGALLALLGGATVEGIEHLPRRGPLLLVSNHVSDADPPIVAWATGYQVRRVVYFMAKAEMRRWPIVGPLFAHAGVFFVRRGEADRAAQRQALALLHQNRAVAVFPEGTRSRDGVLQPGKLGIALLAMRSGAPLLPVAISGTERIFPPGARFVHRAHVRIHIGESFRLEHRSNGRIEREELQAATDEVMRHIAALLPPDRRGAYG